MPDKHPDERWRPLASSDTSPTVPDLTTRAVALGITMPDVWSAVWQIKCENQRVADALIADTYLKSLESKQ